jgi:hypothetical protein
LPLISPAKELREIGAPGVVGVGVGVGVGLGVGVGTAGIVVEVTWRMSVSGVGDSVCARAPEAAPSRHTSAKRAANGRDRRKEYFTKNPPKETILNR